MTPLCFITKHIPDQTICEAFRRFSLSSIIRALAMSTIYYRYYLLLPTLPTTTDTTTTNYCLYCSTDFYRQTVTYTIIDRILPILLQPTTSTSAVPLFMYQHSDFIVRSHINWQHPQQHNGVIFHCHNILRIVVLSLLKQQYLGCDWWAT